MSNVIGGTGVMFATDRLDAAAYAAFGRRVEAIGLDTIWVPELFGREPFAAASFLLAATERVQVGTSIANIYARDAVAAATGRQTLAELSGGRFALGLGVSNVAINEARGHQWEPPVAKMTAYLEAMAVVEPMSPAADAPAPVFVAAHQPKMLEVAAQHADGAKTWLMTPDHTSKVRDIVGPDKGVVIAQMSLLCEDPTEARRLARRALSGYVTYDYYHRAWKRLGFDDDDFADGGSDRLVDTVVAWGDADAIGDRLRSQRDAGADHIVIVPLNPAGGREPAWDLLEAVAEHP
jgi:probable F420-dependent oxidoreductase